jgi:hypothetical protein
LSKRYIDELLDLLARGTCPWIKEPPSNKVLYRAVSMDVLPRGYAVSKSWQPFSKGFPAGLGWSEQRKAAEHYFSWGQPYKVIYRAKVSDNPGGFLQGRGGLYRLVDVSRQEVDVECLAVLPTVVDSVLVYTDDPDSFKLKTKLLR